MPAFNCKKCGAPLEITEGMTVCECEFCGVTQTLPKTSSDQVLNMYNRANHFRQQCEFDKAAEIYERLLSQEEGDSEIHWSLVLCRYGIEYVDDPVTRRKIPTCHRVQYKSILEDPDYLTALDLADTVQRSVYEEEAQAISEIQKGILEISNKEEPFDVFICYKETGDDGRRTQDSVLAQDLYYQLTQEGFKVFFSRITLESKLGVQYEPYIFAALNSAKVMVVVGTKPEYFNAVWVRNEWSRYLMLMQSDRSRTLIPAYRDMDPYDIPEALSMFQAQDMSKLGFMQDLIRGIKKIVVREENEQPQVIRETVVQTAASSNIENLLKRGNLCLEDCKWDEARKYFDDVLNENVEEHRAYIGLLCAEQNVVNEKFLVNIERDFTGSDYYKKACRFGGAKVKDRLFGYNQLGLYNKASRILDTAETTEKCDEAAAMFRKLGTFSDSAQKVEECNEKKKEILYNTVVHIMENARTDAEFIKVRELFLPMRAYRDCEEKITECNEKIYNAAERHMAVYEYREAKKDFDTIRDYSDSAEKSAECAALIPKADKYNSAKQKMSNKDVGPLKLRDLASEFDKISDYRDSVQLAEKCRETADKMEAYRKAKEEEAAEKAKSNKIKMIRISTVIAIVLVCIIAYTPVKNAIGRSNLYKEAVSLAEQGNYDEAIEKFGQLGNYKDSADKISQTRYNQALSLVEQGEYNTAINMFNDLGDYMDSEQKMNEIRNLCLSNIGEAKTGNVISFGLYEWYVINAESNKLTLLCVGSVGSQKYGNESLGKISARWEYSSIRKWLNEDFYNTFTDSEKSLIIQTLNNNDSDNDTEDYVYLLTENEAADLSDKIRTTGFVYWLRTRSDESKVKIVDTKGEIDKYGSDIDSIAQYQIRPVLNIKI